MKKKIFWEIQFKVKEKKLYKQKLRAILSEINIVLPTEELNNVWSLINSEVNRLSVSPLTDKKE